MNNHINFNMSKIQRLSDITRLPLNRLNKIPYTSFLNNKLISLGLSKNKVIGRQQVMYCSLELMSFVWSIVLFISLISYYILLPNYFINEEIELYNWIIFLHIAMTILWVVLSRAVNNNIRRILFGLWVTTLSLSMGWLVMQQEYTNSVFLFVVIVLIGLFTLSEITRYINFNLVGSAVFRYSIGLIIICILTLIFVKYIINKEPFNMTHLQPLILAITYLIMQLISTWTYLHHNDEVWLVDTTCIFASMSPWSEIVDAFSVFNTNNCV